MSEIKMPEPAFRLVVRKVPRILYTGAQMEAYAAAKVREALEALPIKLMIAITSCPHDIDHNQVVLHFDSKQEGHGALNQVGRRIEAAIRKLIPQQ